ncbi:DNA polymerase III subunit alpha [Ornithinibacillus halotolerans]|uniref:DNA polymerase III subunit alpha n=1 Tax=Ornithinibacillus halotolerans TaxID=1274357 RepID=A0A916WB61_9BACI|nr:DNA polymerase III subunit alpha [Ornithinibacillus halotolerans]GGA81991.1 DNA polymerase III subunit alpha [Ornithinibacillus halotolerans]
MSYTHLQVKTGYSFLNSTITIDKLVNRASQLNFNALAITDENVLYGVIPFYKACLAKGIKPIIGMTVTVIDEDVSEHIVLLAKSNHGYKQLTKLSTTIQQNQLDGITKQELFTYLKELVVIVPIQTRPLSGLLENGLYHKVDEYVSTWQSIVPREDFYLGISKFGLEQEEMLASMLRTYQQNNHVQVVAINDVRYLREQDVYAYDCLQAMKNGKEWTPSHTNFMKRNHHLRSSIEMEQVFHSWPEVVQETINIQEKCTVTFDFDARMIPSYPVPKEKTAHKYLEEICRENIATKYENITNEIKIRLEHELAVIKSMAFSDYFLIVWDFIRFAKENGIMVGPGRGSSAGSIVAYCLGITDVDPMKYNLLFERFLNPERITMPDIDIDFSDIRRDEVITYVREKYGSEHVAQIITFGTFATRSLIRELGKTMAIDSQDITFILRQIPSQNAGTISNILKSSKELTDYVQQSDQLKTLFKVANVLEGLPRHLSTHAAGVVISEAPLVNHVPLTKGTSETALTQYAMTDLESLGLLKMDFLGLRNLTLIERIVKSIQYKENVDFDLKQIPENDPKTFELLQSGKTNGVFQLESDGMKQVLERLKPTSFEDIVAVNALYRPGPMDFIPTYIERKHGKKKTTFLHPDLKPILESTYGVLIYQEQIMQIAHRIAGYSFGEADILRRAVSKKKQDVMDRQQDSFIQGCLRNGYTREIGEEIFTWIVKFSNYGFPKSHAVAYSKISYQLAYLKAHYPKHFYAELLTSIGSQHDKIHSYMKEMKDLGIKIAPPSINNSYGRFSVERDCIRMGLQSIKGVGKQAIAEIIDVRKHGYFKNLFDFCLRVPPKIVNRATIESLILAGAFDETYSNRASLLASIDQAIDSGELFREFTDQPNLFENELELEPSYVDIADFSQIKKLADEKELLGIYVSSHPLVQYRSSLRGNGYVSLQHAKEFEKKNLKSAAIIQEIKTIRTKRGEQMAFLTLSDETDDMDGVVFPELYRNTRRFIEEEKLIFISGKIESRNGKKQWLLSTIEPFDTSQLLEKTKSERLFIKITDETSNEALPIIQEIANLHPGTTPIIVYHEEQKKTYQLLEAYYIHINRDSLRLLSESFGEKNVVYQKV